MENRNIIIVLIVIIVILAAAVGILFTQSINAKEPTKIRITSNKTLYEGDNLSIKLTDLNKTPLSKQKINITIKNSKGKIVANKTVKTNSKGKAKLDLDLNKGKYIVTATYAGNENYTGNNTTQKLTIKEKVVQAKVSQSNDNRPSFYDKIKVERDPVSGGTGIDLSQLSQDEYAQYLGYSDAEEMNRETERKRQEAYARHYQ